MNNIENAAKMMVTSFSNFPDDVQEDMKQAYQNEQYQKVLDIAAAHDVRRRNELDSKIKAVINTEFKLWNKETKENIHDYEEKLTPWERDMIMFASRDAETTWGEYEWNNKQMYLYAAEDVPGRVFETVAEAIDAYCLKKGIDRHDKSKKHQFTRHLVQDVDDVKEDVEIQDSRLHSCPRCKNVGDFSSDADYPLKRNSDGTIYFDDSDGSSKVECVQCGLVWTVEWDKNDKNHAVGNK